MHKITKEIQYWFAGIVVLCLLSYAILFSSILGDIAMFKHFYSKSPVEETYKELRIWGASAKEMIDI